MISLRDFATDYLDQRDVTDAYAHQIHWFVNAFERVLEREPRVYDLNLETVNYYLKQTREFYANETRKSHRRMVLTLWQSAADDEYVDLPPRHKVMKIKVRDKIHRAWTLEEAKILLAATKQMRGCYQNGVSRQAYWRSYVLGAWDSGLRGCDMREIQIASLTPDGWCLHVQVKTGRMIRILFRRETLEAISESFPPDREKIWEPWGRLENWRREAKRLVDMSGLKGSVGRLRHSSGTAVELRHPGRGHEHLGNTRQVFEQHYLDHQMTAQQRILPVSLLDDPPDDHAADRAGQPT